MIRIRQIKLGIDNYNDDGIKKIVSSKLKVKEDKIKDIKITKESIDARNKKSIMYVIEVNVLLDNETSIIKKINSKDIELVKEEKYVNVKHGSCELNNRPIVVGSGPCGLFAALVLAENGYKPLVIERGEKVEDRVKTVNHFWETNELNTNSNVAFGEGGAGTFSDGKLNTLVDDKNARIKKVFETFVMCGAPSEILYSNKPHIGTDVLRKVVVNIREKIIGLGGEFLYNSTLTDIVVKDNMLTKIIINDTDSYDCDALVLAIGHSARDTFKMLYDRKLNMESKPFAIGVRIQHPQKMINESQYGEYASKLPNVSYKLTYKSSNDRGVYTFCMCPGGYVVNSSSEEGRLIINGMSDYARDSENANSAVVVTVSKDDFGSNPLNGLEYQRNIEKLAYRKGAGLIPVQLWKDYKKNVISTKFGSVKPVFKGGYSFANINEILPYYINDSIKVAITNFNKKIKGFAMDDAIIAGVETRTSSAIRIIRDDDMESNINGIYPSGEGAGYSGGITTSAVDGIKTAEKIIIKYSNKTLN